MDEFKGYVIYEGNIAWIKMLSVGFFLYCVGF